jgi:hypothetical protein
MYKIFAIKYSTEKRETVEPPLPTTDCEGAFDQVDRVKLLQILEKGIYHKRWDELYEVFTRT